MSTKYTTEINLNEDFSCEKSQLIEFELSSKKIQIPYFQLLKFCTFFKQESFFQTMINFIKTKLDEITNEKAFEEGNAELFFEALEGKNIELSNENYWYLYQLSEKYEVSSLKNKLFQYGQEHSNDVSFLINLIIERQKHQEKTEKIEKFLIQNYSNNIEDIFSNQISSSLSNERFGEIQFSTIFLIMKKSDKKQIPSDLLFEFIMKKIQERYLLFSFVKVSELNDQNFQTLYDNYLRSEENQTQHYYSFLTIEIEYIKRLKDDQRKLEEIRNQMKEIEQDNINLRRKLKETENERNNINDIKNELNNKFIELQNENLSLTKNISELKIKSEEEIQQMKNEHHKLKEELNEVQKNNDNYKQENNQLKEESIEKSKIIEKMKKENQEMSTQIEILEKAKNSERIANENSCQQEIIKLLYSHKEKIEECWSEGIFHKLTDQFCIMHVK